MVLEIKVIVTPREAWGGEWLGEGKEGFLEGLGS